MLFLRKSPRMRPDFNVAVSSRGPQVLANLERQLSREDAPFVGQTADRHAVVRMPESRSSLLSPILDLELLGQEGEGLVLKGRFTPHPNVWTGFMAVFATLGLLGIAGMMYGFAQITIDERPWALLAGPIAAALIAFVYGAVFIGQGLVADEMYALRAFVDRAILDAGVETDQPV